MPYSFFFGLYFVYVGHDVGAQLINVTMSIINNNNSVTVIKLFLRFFAKSVIS